MRGADAVDSTVVAGQGQGHHGTHGRLPLLGHNAIGDAAHCKDRGLGRIDNGIEGIYTIHAQVAYCKGPACEIVRKEPGAVGTSDQVGPTCRNLIDAQAVGPMYYRHKQTVFDSYGQADVDVRIGDDFAVVPEGVQAGEAGQRERCQLREHVGVGDLGPVCGAGGK